MTDDRLNPEPTNDLSIVFDKDPTGADKSNLTFTLKHGQEEVIRCEEGGKIFIRGEEVDDNKAVYQAFRGWMEGGQLLSMDDLQPLSINIYDPRNVVIAHGGKRLGLIQEIKFEAAVDRIPPVLEVTLPDESTFEVGSEQAQELSKTIDAVLERGGTIKFKNKGEFALDSNPVEQALAEESLSQMIVGPKAHTETHTDRPTLDELLKPNPLTSDNEAATD